MSMKLVEGGHLQSKIKADEYLVLHKAELQSG